MKKIFCTILIFLLFYSCKTEDKLAVDVSKISVAVDIKRFEQIFYNATVADLPKIKNEFRAIFPHDTDSVWLNKMKNKEERALFNAVIKAFPDLKNEKLQLVNLFKHIKYYYPNFATPEIITVISNVPLEQKVILDNKILYISLDVFLGKDHEFYEYYPDYIKQNLSKEQLIIEVAKVFAKEIQLNSTNRTFVSKMIQKGKMLYVIDAFLPTINDAKKISYTNKQLNWNSQNEEMIWRYFIEKKLLFSTDTKLDARFLDDAPFSKFYLDMDSKTPGRVGEWLGWQIVKSFMDYNKISLTEMLQIDNERLFKRSKYNPSSN
jgi:gliding motility-associated lipoprotein GldB